MAGRPFGTSGEVSVPFLAFLTPKTLISLMSQAVNGDVIGYKKNRWGCAPDPLATIPNHTPNVRPFKALLALTRFLDLETP